MACLTNHSLFTPSNKYITPMSAINVVEGAKTLAKLDLCNIKIPYEQFFQTYIYLKENTFNNEINYSNLGEQITFIAFKVTYEPIQKSLIPPAEKPILEYFFSSNPTEIRHFDTTMVLSGNSEHLLPKIYLNNPSLYYRAKVEIIASTTLVTWEVATSEVEQIGTNYFTIENLVFNNIISDMTNTGFIIINDLGEHQIYIKISTISNIELNGRIMLIDDLGIGKIQLIFKTEFDCLQAYSGINWVIGDPANRQLSTSTLPDLTMPDIIYKSSFTTEFILNSYGTSGNHIITKTDIFNLLIDHGYDTYRDGYIYMYEDNLSLSKVNQNIKIDAITSVGKYSLLIQVEDNAKNKRTDSFVLNVKDLIQPVVILNNIGNTFYGYYNDGTSGTNASILPKIYVEDFGYDTIVKQDLIELLIASVTDNTDGVYQKNTNNITVTIVRTSDNAVLNSITNSGTYNVYFQVIDSEGNVSDTLWSSATNELSLGYVTIRVLANQAPVVNFFDIPELYLTAYSGNKINKSDLQTFIDNVTDDRDGIITTSILNTAIYELTENGTNGTNAFVYSSTSSTSSVTLSYIDPTEIIYINESGYYQMNVIVVDSDGKLSTGIKKFYVL